MVRLWDRVRVQVGGEELEGIVAEDAEGVEVLVVALPSGERSYRRRDELQPLPPEPLPEVGARVRALGRWGTVREAAPERLLVEIERPLRSGVVVREPREVHPHQTLLP